MKAQNDRTASPGEIVMMHASQDSAASSGQERAATTVSGSYVPEVDALRCLAMTAVIAVHCSLLPIGWMGVWLFFVISGFAVTTSLFSGKHEDHGPWARIGAFYGRRALRIWPIYFGYIAVSVLFIVAFRPLGDLAEVPWLLTFTQNMKMIIESYVPGTCWGGFAHLWTISVEQQFYLVFPVLLLLPTRRLRGVALVAVVLIVPVVRYVTGIWSVAHGYDPLHAAFAVYAFAPAQFDAFAAGALIALFRREIAANARFADLAAIAAVTISVVYVLTYATINLKLSGHVSVGVLRNILSGILYGQGRDIWGYYVPTSLSVALLMSILVRKQLLIRLCQLPGLQAIGRISYGGYLYHVAVLMVLTSTIPLFETSVTGIASYLKHIVLFVCAFGGTVALAWLSYNYIELPIIRLARPRGNRVARPQPQTGEA